MESWIIVLIAIGVMVVVSLVYYLTKKNKTEDIQEIIEDDTSSETVNHQSIVEDITSSHQETPIFTEVISVKSESSTTISISSKTEKDILKKLELFEKNKSFLKKDINLNSLAKQFQTNTKYLSEIIKTHRKKPFNSYLNELRINYIINRLKTEPQYINTKVSYLASDCGFTSHSTFTTIFTQIMNESPSIYIKKLKSELNN